MANTQAVCTSFKVELFNGHHALGTAVTRGATTADTIKAALFLASATINASTTAYSTTGEVTGTNYTAGGVTVTNGNASCELRHDGILDAFSLALVDHGHSVYLA